MFEPEAKTSREHVHMNQLDSTSKQRVGIASYIDSHGMLEFLIGEDVVFSVRTASYSTPH